ncbi:YIP1 family protein [Eikenella sp. S3360]|uniref:YIP1 family protein n=1 Tax=Eikenella glucosivorans TaxID=2766967 RepID=A0ABS0ND93_9NEIS|nr:Yip1 family protein [Eikenella glucosivorans]MBH5330230.1 YIP1 family protein [Eikenella glucosivorans]
MNTKKRLIALSLALYILSLSLPAVGGQIGLAIMYASIAFGWLGMSVGMLPALAGYANLFYWWAAVQLLRGKEPMVVSWFCMVFACFSLLIPLMPVLMMGHEFASVGWGALLWFAALWLMRLAAITENSPEALRRACKKWAKVSAVIIFSLFAFGRWQYYAANTQQQGQYFPVGTVFAFMLPSSLPYIEPPQSLPAPDNGTAEWLGGLEISDDNRLTFVSGSLKEYHPPKRFIYQGYLIQEYFHEDGILSITPAEKPADYRYGYRPAKAGEQGEQIQFIQKASGQTLWQAPVKRMEFGQYPDYGKTIQRLWQTPKHNDISAAFDANPAQTFAEACPIEPYSAPFKLHEPLQIDGKIYSDKYRSPLAQSRILCNDTYILWLNAPAYRDYDDSVELSAVLIRRRDMLPVEKYRTTRYPEGINHAALKQAAAQPQAWLAGIRRMETRRRADGYTLQESELVIEGGNGEWVLR